MVHSIVKGFKPLSINVIFKRMVFICVVKINSYLKPKKKKKIRKKSKFRE